MSKTPYIKTRPNRDKIRRERKDIVLRMKLEGWQTKQIAGHIGVKAGLVSAIIMELKKEGRLPRHRMLGTKNPLIGEGYSTRGRVYGR